jgi:hypothetical protein
VGLPAQNLAAVITFAGLAVLGTFFMADQWFGYSTINLIEDVLGFGGFSVTALTVIAVSLRPEKRLPREEAPGGRPLVPSFAGFTSDHQR